MSIVKVDDVRRVWAENFKEVGIGSPQEAVANTVDYMTNPHDDRVMMLSDIGKDEQQQIETMFVVGGALRWDWMVEAGKVRLALCSSRKGKRAVLLAKMLQSSNLFVEGAGKIGSAVKNFVSGEGL